MASQILSVGAILLSTVFLLAGNGFLLTYAPLRASINGFSDLQIGILGSFYFAGFAAGCVIGPHVFARVGHIRTFAAAAALCAAAVLVLQIFPVVPVWYGARMLTGFCIAGLYMALESWLNDRATNETRGMLLSCYMVVTWLAFMAGQWILLVTEPESFVLFSVTAILFCICLIPVGFTKLAQPTLTSLPRLDLRRLFRITPVGVMAAMTVGFVNGAFWMLAPVYARSLGFSTTRLALFMTAFIVGGALIQWPLGRWSDRIDRRWVIAAICTSASFCGLVLGVLGGLLSGSTPVFLLLVFLLGASVLPLYSISVAHANDRFERADFVQVSAGLLLIQAASSVPGPLLASAVTSVAGPYALFLYMALIDAAMAFYVFNRIRVRERAPEETREPFAPMPQQASPAVLLLDPRAPQQ
jgi:MFS family permease